MKHELPEGWSSLPFINCIEKLSSSNKLKISQKDFEEKGIYAIVDQGINFIAGYTDDKDKIYNGDLPVIIFGDHTRIFKYIDFPFALGADGTKIISPKKEMLNPKYFYYFLKGILIEDHGYSRHYKFLKEKEITIPPLETQHKIVAILEKAEETKKIRAHADELSQLLLQSIFLEMFRDPVTNSKGWHTKKLEKLCIEMLGGGTPSKSKPEYYKGEIPWVTPKDMKQDFILDSIDHISENAVKESSTKIIPSNSLLMVIRSGILKKKLPIALNLCEVTLNQDMKGFVFDKTTVNPLFMLHYFKIYQKYLLNRVRSVTADNLEFKQIKNIDVIVPPIELQNNFAVIVEQLRQINENQKQSAQETDALFNTLMQKAFNGDLMS